MANKLICQGCLEEVDSFKDEKQYLCSTCYRRKRRMGEKYIAVRDLPEKEKVKLLNKRKYDKAYLENKAKSKIRNEKIKQTKLENKYKEMDEEIEQNLKDAFKKIQIDESIIKEATIEDKTKKLDEVVNMIDEILNFDKAKAEEQKAEVNKKVSTIDNYIIDILHTLENTDLEDEDTILREGIKIIKLRKIRREYKNEEKVIMLKKKAFLAINKDTVKLNDSRKEIQSFKCSLSSKFYNPYVENPNNDDRILGLHKYRCQCKVTSSTTERKIIQFNEIVKAKNQEEAKQKVIEIIRERHGEDVVWTTIYASFIR